ncbi:type VI secretion system-associated protein TagF [Rhizobium oryziradicis]|uniref:Type VI secretion-associated protein n=1 Tax=Rhizobium oryziradicis TaxID=1867956 RepID=A0A1Q8ZL62_9HYPH|nr:type VI secretion system-associated protein TagF [Rhizobium oryziradicis]OLP42538.1 type VI secretion-associated protein [Rhizobium oryziradicis]
MALRSAPKPKPSGQDRIGFFGKLPSHGDFISEGLERDTITVLDAWIRGGLHACEQEFGAHWPKIFAASPPWRFIVEKGVWGDATYAGVMLPSKDRVGRSFPLLIVAQLHEFAYHPRTLYLDHTWFMAAEGLAETSLTRDFDIGHFTASLKRMRLPRPEDEEGGRVAQTDPSALWWYIDTETGRSRGVRLQGTLAPQSFVQLFRESNRSKPQDSPAPVSEKVEREPARSHQAEHQASMPRKIAYGYATHAGTRFSLNADSLFLCDKPALFAIADGVGDQPIAAEAAKLATHSLTDIGEAVSVEAMIQEIKGKLGRANSLLLARQNRGDHGPLHASIITAALMDGQALLLWAGDARGYLLRDGIMRPLTRDHVSVGLQKRLRRGVGLEQQFLPEALIEPLNAGDRLLLCSYPLVHALKERTIAEILLESPGVEGAESLVQEALIANVRENISAIVIGYGQDDGA